MNEDNSVWTIKQRCSTDWEQMRGDDKRRFCENCQRFVYNVSAMAPAERAAFADPANRRECVYYSETRTGRVVDLSLLARVRRWLPFLKLLRWSTLVAVLPMFVTGCMGVRMPPAKVTQLPRQSPPSPTTTTNQTTNAVSPEAGKGS